MSKYYAQYETPVPGQDEDYIWIGEESDNRPRSELDHVVWFAVSDWPMIIAEVEKLLGHTPVPEGETEEVAQ